MDNDFHWMKSMSQLRTLTLFILYYLLSSSAGQRDGREIQLMRHAPCSNRMTGESGICTFNWSCVNVAHGVHIGHCVDRFFIGSCCKFPEEKNASTWPSNSNSSGGTESTEEEGKMDMPVSFFHDLAATIKRQEAKRVTVKVANNSDEAFSTLPENFSHIQLSIDSAVTVENKGYWDYSLVSNHNRKPILPEVAFHDIFSHISKPNDDLHKSVSPHSLINPQSYSGYISEQSYPEYSTVTSTISSHKKPPSLEETHDQRNPITTHVTHDQRKPITQLVNVDTTHHLRKPVATHDTFNQRHPVEVETQHNNRKPVPLNEDHDQRWPVLEEDSNDERLSAYDITKWIGNISSTENNTIPYDELTYFTQSKPSYNELSTKITTQINPLLSIFNYFQGGQNFDSSLNDFEHDIIQSVFNTSEISESSPESKNISSTINSSSHSITSDLKSDMTSAQKFSASNVSQVCGRPRRSTTARIVGGRKSQHLRWPWMISLQRYEGKVFKHKCGATLLNEYWAATAAHCIDGKLPKDLKLRLGEYNFLRSDDLHPYVERRVYVMVVHPEFNPSTYESDLALLRFEDPVRYQANIVPVCLPSIMDDITGRIAVVTGWGKLAEEGELPSALHEVYVPIISNRECESMYFEAGYDEAIRDVFVCAGVSHGGLDACEGDSGGPMVIKGQNGQWVLVGLISWGISCAAPKQPGVYTRISEFKDWINGIIAH